MEVDTVDTSFRTTHIFFVVEQFGVRVTVGEGERSATRLAGIVTRAGYHIGVEAVGLDTTAVVVGSRTVNRVGGVAATLGDCRIVGGILVEVVVVERRAARGNGLRAAVRHRIGQCLRRNGQCRNVHRTRNGVVGRIDSQSGIDGRGVNQILVSLVLRGGTEIQTIVVSDGIQLQRGNRHIDEVHPIHSGRAGEVGIQIERAGGNCRVGGRILVHHRHLQQRAQ